MFIICEVHIYTNLYVVRHCHVCRYVIVDNISFCLNYRNSNTYRVIRYGIYTFLKSKVERKVGPLLRIFQVVFQFWIPHMFVAELVITP